mgnify:CR=1 FL=1
MDIHALAVIPLTAIHHDQPENVSLLVGSYGGTWVTGPALGCRDLAPGEDQLESGCCFLGLIILLLAAHLGYVQKVRERSGYDPITPKSRRLLCAGGQSRFGRPDERYEPEPPYNLEWYLENCVPK